MATPLARRPEPGDGSPQAAVTISAVTEYLLPATMRGVAVQAAAALGVLTGLWVALSPSFLTLQHGGGNAAVANLIAGLAVAATSAASLVGPRGLARDLRETVSPQLARRNARALRVGRRRESSRGRR